MPTEPVPRTARSWNAWRQVLMALAITVGTVLCCWLVGITAASVWGNRNAPWIIGRAAGITSYLLLVALVILGLMLSHPWRSRVHRPSTANRIRAHVALSVFTVVFTVLHVLVLATDSYAGVGIAGALVPMGSTYRPVPVTLGVVGLYAGLAAGITAATAGRFGGRLWWPVHKVAAVSLLLVWGHGVLAGSDSAALLAVYLSTGALVLLLGVSRYVARTTGDRVADLTAGAATARSEREVTRWRRDGVPR